mgnify:FL=1|tara:strand:- start:4437 stop:4697 length:261 start_codon:yes stop_codon:yes gene_type:complete
MKNIKLKEDILVEELDGKLVVLSLDNGIFFEINESGNEIIKLIKLGLDYNAIVEEFKNIYGISYQDAESDIKKFLNHLETKSILSK